MEQRNRLEAALFNHLIEISAIPLIGSAAGGILVAVAQWRPDNAATVSGWLGAVLAVTGLRILLTLRCRARVAATGYDRREALRYAATTALSGLAWGAGGLMVNGATPVALAITITAVQAMVMGGVLTLGAFLPSFYAFAVPAILPMVVTLAIAGDMADVVLAVYSLIFLLLMIGIAHRFNGSLRRTWQLTFDKEDLASAVAEAHQRTLAEERLRLAEKERLETMLRQWMADTSHELRTPISVLRAQIEAVQDGIFIADAKRLELLHTQVMGMTRLIEDLFTLARSDIGQLDSASAPVDIVAVLDGIVDAFHGRYAAAGLDIEWPESAAGNGPLVAGDEARLRQVFANLLENSLRYTDAGGRLRIGVAGDGHDLILHFDDTAPGVPDESLPRLFDRFFRVDVSRSRARGGSGIGLALCRGMAEAHRGTITASHSPLGGLRVTLRLPRMEIP